MQAPMDFVTPNLVGFSHVLDACHRLQVPRLLYASSSSVYGMRSQVPFVESDRTDQPQSFYAATKMANELMAYAYQLSGGEKRRLEITRALVTSPRLLLLDEPFAGIDPIAVIEIQRIIGFLKSRGIGVLITDHNVRETLGICDHAYIISEGQVLATGTPAEIVSNADVRRVYLGEHFKM